MTLLVDTHAWLWFLLTPDRLAEGALDALSDRRNTVKLSVASEWEIVIKYALRRLPLPEPPSTFLPSRASATATEVWPIEERHVLRLQDLPAIHRDPFDRIIIAQALVDDLIVVTSDAAILKYDVPTMWAAKGSAPGR